MEIPVPTGRLGRAARLAAVGLRTGAGRLLRRAETARELADALGTMRGLAAKMGQMVSYVDGLVPEDQREVWETTLGALQAAAPRSSPAGIRRIVEEELGAPIDRLFAEWEDVPIASASIGQVHRARLEDGRKVAVKVQHPGIAAAVESDIGNVGVLEMGVAMLGARKLNSKELLEELAARFREELDYRAEGAYQERFRAFHADDPRIRIPAVIADRSARRVLTTEFVEGLSFAAACAAPEAERAAWCRTMWRFVYRATTKAGIFNADPHPGNYLFHDDGRVTFLDFGCVHTVSEHLREADEDLHRAAIDRNDAAFDDAGRRLLSLRPGPQEVRSLRQLRAMYQPLFRSPFRVTREFSAGLLELMRQAGRESRAVHDAGDVRLPRGTLLMNRLQFGFYSVLARLDAEVDYAAVERGFLT